MFFEFIAKGIFQHKSGSHERRNAQHNVATALNALESFVLRSRGSDRITRLMQKFLARCNAEKNVRPRLRTTDRVIYLAGINYGYQ